MKDQSHSIYLLSLHMMLGLIIFFLACRLMEVKTPKEISVAFNSLVHLFHTVEVKLKSIALDPDQEVPAQLSKAHNVQQVALLASLLSLLKKVPGKLCHSL